MNAYKQYFLLDMSSICDNWNTCDVSILSYFVIAFHFDVFIIHEILWEYFCATDHLH